MASYKKNKKRIVIKPRFYLFMAIFAAVIIWVAVAVINFFAPPVVKWGKLSTDQEISAIIVRDEQLVYSEEYGKFDNVAGEGDAISQGQEVALLYKPEFSSDDLDTLIDVRQQIKNYQEENILKNVIHDSLLDIDGEIDRLINEIAELVRAGEDRVLSAKEHELRSLMEQKRLYMNDNLHKDGTLEARFFREEVLLEKIENNITHLYAPSDGIISFFLDGLETYLTLERIESINIDAYQLIEEKILNSTVESNINEGSIVTADQPIYRIISPNHWYAIIKIPRSKNTLVKGGTCDITFENYGHTLSNVYVSDVRSYGKEEVIVLEFGNDIGPMASLRIVTGTIGRSNEGFVIPIEYIAQSNVGPGVWVIKEDNTEAFIPVNIIAQNYMEAVVEQTAESTEQLKQGQKLKKP